MYVQIEKVENEVEADLYIMGIKTVRQWPETVATLERLSGRRRTNLY
jgi:hypothetical protein